MLGLSRSAPKRVYFISRRSLAEVVPITAKSAPIPHPVTGKLATQTLRDGKVPVSEDHGLWHFFRRKGGENLVGDACYETVEHPSKVEQSRTGRAWKASELRLKSFDDLHTLWYVVLRERNLLATQKEEARRMGVSDTGLQVSAERVHQCRKTMARIKAVLNERRLAYEGALKLIEEQKQQAEDEVVLQYQRQKFEEERAHTLSRRELTERRRKARLLRKEAEAQQASTEAAEVASMETKLEAHDSPQEAQSLLDAVGTASEGTQNSELMHAPSSSVGADGQEAAVERTTKPIDKTARRKTPEVATDALFGTTGQGKSQS